MTLVKANDFNGCSLSGLTRSKVRCAGCCDTVWFMWPPPAQLTWPCTLGAVAPHLKGSAISVEPVLHAVLCCDMLCPPAAPAGDY